MTDYPAIYPVLSDVQAMIKLTDDSVSIDLINVSMKNADNIINNSLEDWSLPTYTNEDSEIPRTLVTIGNYLTVSDIHQALDGTDDRATNEEGYYQKAMDMLDKYIRGQKDKLALTELRNKSPYGVSQSPSPQALGLRR